MAEPLSIICVQDDSYEVKFIRETLRFAGVDADLTVVANQDDFIDAFMSNRFDVILADYLLPGFDGMEALAYVRASDKCIPFLFVTGAVGEERVVDMLKAGATDYILKDRLTRLAPAITRALQEAKKQRDKAEMIERLRMAKQAAQKANLAKSRFLAAMSHEIRTPLTAIIGFTELIVAEGMSCEERHRFVDCIQRNGELLLRLIDDILDLSKVEAGKTKIEQIEFKLDDFIGEIETTMRAFAADKGLQFQVTRENTLPATMISDPTRLRQILSNIIGNAIKFTASGVVEVSLSTDEKGELLRCKVKDNGPGIAFGDVAKLFTPFEQVDSSIKKKYGGSGLGLVISKRLASALGGDVRLLSSEVGKGSIFEITVGIQPKKSLKGAASPAAKFHDESRPREDSATRQGASGDEQGVERLDGVHILLAEDSIDNQFLISTFLTLAGATVDVAKDGEEAVSKGLKQDYDVILMDVQMPKLDGLKATARLRAHSYFKPVIALSAFAMAEEQEKCLQAGCDDSIAKPVSRQELVATVRRIVDESQ